MAAFSAFDWMLGVNLKLELQTVMVLFPAVYSLGRGHMVGFPANVPTISAVKRKSIINFSEGLNYVLEIMKNIKLQNIVSV